MKFLDKILILGAGGQVGRALVEALPERALPIIRAQLDLADAHLAEAFETLLEQYAPGLVINAAAYTQVDKAENEARAEAFAVNAVAPGVLASLCAVRNIPFIHYSTDYVFDGSGSAPWTETDICAPLNAYGLSKWEGEQAVREAGGKALILRTSWVYDAKGKNFLTTMLKLGREREELRVVADQWGAPTFAEDIAGVTLAIAAQPYETDVYHLTNAGVTTWHGFAEAIFREARACGMALKVKRLIPIETKDYPTPAVRPKNSRLDCAKLESTFAIRLRPWEEALKACMREVI